MLIYDLFSYPFEIRPCYQGRVGPVVARSTTDREARGLNLTLAQREFVSAQEMNLRGSTQPGVNWYPERAVTVQVRYSWVPYVDCTQNQE